MTVVNGGLRSGSQHNRAFDLGTSAAVALRADREAAVDSRGSLARALSERRNERDIHYKKIVVPNFPEYIFTFSNLWDKAKCALNGSVTDVVGGRATLETSSRRQG
jgi:hypothetical protein